MSWFRKWVREQSPVLLFFTVWSAVLSWPLVRYFTARIAGGGDDPRHNLWVLWHVKEATLGRQPLWELPQLYYPAGVSLLTHGLGPAPGWLALPFWPAGPEAAYNGAFFVSLILSAYAVYLLARELRLTGGVALFAGLFVLAAPMHLAGLRGHLEKVLLLGPALVLLALTRTLRPERTPLWAVATGVALLFTLATNGYQFVIVSLVMPFWAGFILWEQKGLAWRRVARRGGYLLVACLVLVGPMLLAITSAAARTGVNVDLRRESLHFMPDLAEFFLPATHRFLGPAVTSFLTGFGVEPTIETTVYLSWTGLFLAGVALVRGERRGRGLLVLSAAIVVFALGPVLQVLGQRSFTSLSLPIALPYAWLIELPGLEFMRVPGRFMYVGYIVWALAASTGLFWLLERWPQRRRVILLAAMGFVLLEFWPAPTPMAAGTMRSIPAFYHSLADDDGLYGVLDLPTKPERDTWHVGYSSHYQMYQMVHGKGIATGYISRTYESHPFFPCVIPEMGVREPGVFVNGREVDCRRNMLFRLALYNYRYVVWHLPQPSYPEYKPGSWGEGQAEALIGDVFGDQMPTAADGLVRVYPVPSLDKARQQAAPDMVLGQGWHEWEGDFRWARSPAVLQVTTPDVAAATLEVGVAALPPAAGDGATLYVSNEGGRETAVALEPGKTTAIPLALAGGVNRVVLRLAEGNFRPADEGGGDTRSLSFAVSSLDLQLHETE